ncbi:MAG: lysophospholipid acyltransferase family protein [Gammaproteobacteria bacterium]
MTPENPAFTPDKRHQHTLRQRLLSKSARLLISVLGKMPFSWLHALGAFFGTLLFILRTPSRHTTETNFALAFPDWPPERRQRLARESLIHDCRLSFELAYLWTRPATDGQALIRAIRGEAKLDQALADQRGLLLILPHLGNWELTNHYLMAKTPLTALYKPLDLPDVEAKVRAARSLGETHMVPTTQAGVKELMRTLKSGGVSVILPDQSPPAGNGQFSPFYGVPTYTSPLLPKLIKKTQAHCLCIFTERLPNAAGFIIHIESVDERLFATDAITALRGLNASIEQCISPRLTQYLWGYKRFKQRPESHTNPYDDPEFPPIARQHDTQLDHLDE